MLEKIAKKYGSQIFRTYTGFKWIGSLIDEMEKMNRIKNLLLHAKRVMDI